MLDNNYMDEQNTNTVPKEPIKEEPKTTVPLTHSGVPLKTVLLIVLLALVAGILVYVAVSPKKSNPGITTNSTKEAKNPADTILSINPSVKDEALSTYSSDVLVDTGSNTINGVQLELYYDPSIITNVTINSGNFFSPSVELLKKIDQSNGRISYALSVLPGQKGESGKGTFATINYTVIPSLTSDRTSFNFLPKTEVSGENTSGSLLKSTNDGDVIIESLSPTTTEPAQ